MSRVERRRRNNELLISCIALILSILGAFYTVGKDIFLSREKIDITFDKVYCDETTYIEECSSYYVDDKGTTSGLLIPVNCRIILTNRSSKLVSVTDILQSRYNDSEYDQILSVPHAHPIFNFLSIDGEIIKSENDIISKPIVINPNESRILVINMNHLIPKDVEDKILEMDKEYFIDAEEEEDSNAKQYIKSKVLSNYLAQDQLSIWGKMKKEKLNLYSGEVDIYVVNEKQLPQLDVTCVTSKNKSFSKKDQFKSSNL